MSAAGSIKRALYRTLPLESYLRVLSAGFFAGLRLGLGRRSAAYEYPRFLSRVVRRGDVVVDIGANLGYYSRVLSEIVGDGGKVYAVEPVKPIAQVLRHNLRRCRNVEVLPYALGTEDKPITMRNDSARLGGYMGTGRNYVPGDDGADEGGADVRGGADKGVMEFEAEMRRGSELFAELARLDFVKCDIEGYEGVVIPEMEAVILSHMPVVLLETGGALRRPMIELFRGWGYAGYVLDGGRLVSVMRAQEKDIFFIPGHRCKDLICE
jgi:FkbM family methyltransferase